MSFTEFCCRSGGSNLNAGTRTGSSTVPGTSADFTYASGNWVAGTGVFTVASGDPATDGVAVGDFASVYADGSSVTGFVGRVTARDSTTITVSLTAKSGTAPTNGTGNRTLKIGGAWQGPNGASGFPFGFVQGTMVNASSHATRINFMDDATYNITAAMTHGNSGLAIFQGFTSAYADGGPALVDGGTSGSSYDMLTMSGNFNQLVDMEFCNNGATGTAGGVTLSGTGTLTRVVVHNVRGHAITVSTNAQVIECEAYAWGAGGSGYSGFLTTNQYVPHTRCTAHGGLNNGSGFRTTTSTDYHFCISSDNAGVGFLASTQGVYGNCDAYRNGSHGIDMSGGFGRFAVENCNLVANGGYGINAAATTFGVLHNVAFGSGTMANASGQINNGGSLIALETVTYDADVTPWQDPDNGDFRIALAAAKSTGHGNFTQREAGYSGTVGYPDIGAAQHLASGGGTGSIFSTPIIRGVA